jgi:molecular chaperone DnaJ
VLTRNYYLILGCDVTESAGGVRSAFRELIKHYHPDRVGPGGTPFIQEIAQAYRVLSDFDRRHNYALGIEHAGGFAYGEPAFLLPDSYPSLQFPPPAAVRVLRQINLTGSALELVRDRVLRNFVRGETPGQGCADPIDVHLVLRPGEAAAGGIAIVEVPTFYPCPVCRGSGRDEGEPCSECDESGAIEENETVRVPIPPMVENLDLFEAPLRGLGVHNYYLRVLVRIAPDS